MTFLRHPVAAIYANEAAKAAEASMARKYPHAPGGNDEADAYRHALWSHLMAQGIGRETAKAFGDAYEVSGSRSIPPATRGERLMDLYNNEVGRQFPNDQGRSLKNALETDRLRKRPFGEQK